MPSHVKANHKSKPAPAATSLSSTSPRAPLADATNTIKTPPTSKPAVKAPRGKKATQANIDALNAQWAADSAAALARAQAEHDAEVADLNRRLSNLQEVYDAATQQAATDTSLDDTIPRPKGSAGDGFKLIKAMGLDNNKLEYDLIRHDVHVACARVKLARDITFHKQSDRKVAHLCEKMREDYPYLKRFIGDWATKELARQYLKHVRAYEKQKRAGMLAALHQLPFPQHNDDDEAGSAMSE